MSGEVACVLVSVRSADPIPADAAPPRNLVIAGVYLCRHHEWSWVRPVADLRFLTLPHANSDIYPPPDDRIQKCDNYMNCTYNFMVDI